MKISEPLPREVRERANIALQKASLSEEPCFVVFGFGLPPSVVNRAKKLIDREFLEHSEEHK